MTDNSQHGECKVFNSVGILTRVERIQDRTYEDIPADARALGVFDCKDCGIEVIRYHGNVQRCSACSVKRAIQYQKDWKERKREALRESRSKDTA